MFQSIFHHNDDVLNDRQHLKLSTAGLLFFSKLHQYHQNRFCSKVKVVDDFSRFVFFLSENPIRISKTTFLKYRVCSISIYKEEFRETFCAFLLPKKLGCTQGTKKQKKLIVKPIAFFLHSTNYNTKS